MASRPKRTARASTRLPSVREVADEQADKGRADGKASCTSASLKKRKTSQCNGPGHADIEAAQLLLGVHQLETAPSALPPPALPPPALPPPALPPPAVPVPDHQQQELAVEPVPGSSGDPIYSLGTGIVYSAEDARRIGISRESNSMLVVVKAITQTLMIVSFSTCFFFHSKSSLHEFIHVVQG